MLATMARPCLLPRLAFAGRLVRTPRSPRERDPPGGGSCSQRLNLKPSNAPAPPKAAAVPTDGAVKPPEIPVGQPAPGRPERDDLHPALRTHETAAARAR